MKEYGLKASIGIFRKELKTKHETCPYVPNQLFAVVEQVLESKTTQILRTPEAVYIIEYRESGPFQDVSEGWLPIYIAKVTQWTSGGIRQEEIDAYHEER